MSTHAPTAAPTPAALTAPDILVTATPGRWAFRGATDAGCDYVAALGAFGGGEVGLPPALGERFIATARAAGMVLAEAAGDPEPATMPRVQRAAVVEVVA